MADPAVKLVIPSDLKNVYLVDMLIETLCSLVPLDESGAFWIKLCAVEAVNNAIIHAYGKSPDHEVAVRFRIEEDRIVLEVRDTGRAMPRHLLAGQDLDALAGRADDPESVATEGRGLAIIRETMDEVTYGQVDGENRLTMVKRLDNGDDS
jgi:serine/threonine-protein kinase RsbW